MCGQGGVPEDCVKYRSWYMAQLTYSSLSCYVCNESSNKVLSFKKKSSGISSSNNRAVLPLPYMPS
jgi:hypothetical protein